MPARWKCPFCETALTHAELQTHAKDQHPDADVSLCPHDGCNRKIKANTLQALSSHVRDVHGGNSSSNFVSLTTRLPAGPPVSLTCCKKKATFKSATALAHHVVDVHASESCLRAVHKSVAGGLRGAIAQSSALQLEDSSAASVASTPSTLRHAPTAPPASVLSTSSTDDTLARLDRLENEAAVRCALLRERTVLSRDIHREYSHLHEDTDGQVVTAVKETLERLCLSCTVVVSGSRVMRTAIQGSDVDLVVDCSTCAARDAAVAAIFRCSDFSVSGPTFEKGGAKIITFLYKGKAKFDVSVSWSGGVISVAVTQAEIAWFASQRVLHTHVEKVVVYLKGWKDLTPNKACSVLKGASLTCLAVRCMEKTSSLMEAVKEALRELIACRPITALYKPYDNLTAHIKAAEWAGIKECAERQLKHLYVLDRGVSAYTYSHAGKPHSEDSDTPHLSLSLR